MKTISIILVALLCVSSANAVIVTCVSEGSNVVRIDYDASDETSLPIGFALDITVNNGATIPEIFSYKVGDSNAADPGYGIFPRSIQIASTGRLISWGQPDVAGTLGTSNLSIEMASRYEGSANAPLVKDTLCRIRINPNGAQTVNVSVTQNVKAGGVVLENTTAGKFTGIGTILNSTTPPPQAPPAPASINYPATSSTGQYNVTWPASTGATSYQLQRSANNGSTWTGIYSGANLSYAENIGNGSYRYRVSAVNTAGSSAWTAGTFNCVVSISTQPQPPPAPSIISYPSSSSTGKYNVSWAESIGATSYQLQRSNDNGTTWTNIYSGPNHSYSENIGNGSYKYRVRAVNDAGTSAWRTRSTICVVNISVPAAPSSITYPSTSNTGRYTVSWTASVGATSYQLERSRNNGRTWSRNYSGSNLSKSEAVTNGTYLYRVRAVNSAGVSAWRVGTHTCVVTIPRPSTPTSISYPTSSSTGHYTVSWTASTNATSYQLYRSSDGGLNWTRIYSGSNRYYNEAVGSGKYRYRVRAMDYSLAGSFRTGTWDCVVSGGTAAPTSEHYYEIDD